MKFLGMNNFGHHSSITLINDENNFEIHLKERVTQVKADNTVHLQALRSAKRFFKNSEVMISESSYFDVPKQICKKSEKFEAFNEIIKCLKIENFFSIYNPDILFYTHHYCHAMAAVAISPFKKSVIIVMDGAGSSPKAFNRNHSELKIQPYKFGFSNGSVAESCTIYLQDGPYLQCVKKEWQVHRTFKFHEVKISLSEGLGSFYEAAAMFIFGSTFDAGKVMGLASFGKPMPVKNRIKFWAAQDWSNAFKGKTKKQWEASPHKLLYADLAATVQDHFSKSVLRLVTKIRNEYPEYKNIIFSGGCALNCLTNSLIQNLRIYENVFVPPFPGDEGVSLGAAFAAKMTYHPKQWKPRSHKNQTSAFGPKVSNEKIARITKNEPFVIWPKNLVAFAAKLLAQDFVIAWFQGRSETGPRALGNRSLLANPGAPAMKDYLNAKVKGREAFRPYGGSCTWKKASTYFEFQRNADSPFMSFAPKVKSKYKKSLSEITHNDDTSRIQTVRPEQDPLFHNLLVEFGKLKGVECLLNTSMNFMGKPLVETPDDALKFFKSTPIFALVLGNAVIFKKEYSP
jgi:carbamoyltransferase